MSDILLAVSAMWVGRRGVGATGWVRWLVVSEYLCESPVVVLALAHLAIDDGNEVNVGMEAKPFVAGTEDIVSEYVTDALLAKPQSGDELIVAGQRSLVFELHSCHDGVNSLVVEFRKADAERADEAVSGVLSVVKVVRIVNDALDIALVVAHFHACFKYILGVSFHLYLAFKYSYPILQRRHSLRSQYSFFS